MTRTLTITRENLTVGCAVKMGVELDGFLIAKMRNGETESFQIDESSHNLKIVPLSLFDTPTHNMVSPTALIMAGRDDCNVTLSVSLGLVRHRINVTCNYATAQVSETDFIEAVTRFMVDVFNGSAILERLNDPDNRRNDLEIVCKKDGVHIRWQAKEITMGKNWSTGCNEEIIPYEAACVTMPKERLTDELLTQLTDYIKLDIARETPFARNQYGCFCLPKKHSLY